LRRPPALIYARAAAFATASAALFGAGLGTPAHAAASPWSGDAHAAARLVTATEATGSARHLAAGIEIRVAPGWHTYWRSPGDAGVAPRIAWRGSQNLARAILAWPAPRRFSLMGFDTIGYDTDVVLPVQVTLTRPGQPATLRAALDYAACAEICVPYHAELALALPAGPAGTGPEAPLIARFAARVPKTAAAADIVLERAVLDDSDGRLELRLELASTGAPFAGPDLFVEGAEGASFGRPAVALADGGRKIDLYVPVSGAKLADLLGKPLTLTLVDGRRAAEFSATPTTDASDAHYR
jgi:suppressor for copper-sensitivity B